MHELGAAIHVTRLEFYKLSVHIVHGIWHAMSYTSPTYLRNHENLIPISNQLCNLLFVCFFFFSDNHLSLDKGLSLFVRAEVVDGVVDGAAVDPAPA